MPKCRIKGEDQREPRTVKMSEMEPLEVGRIVGSSLDGYLVWRTASEHKPEIVNLSNYRPNGCWTSTLPPIIKVRLLAPGEEVTLVLSNDLCGVLTEWRF